MTEGARVTTAPDDGLPARLRFGARILRYAMLAVLVSALVSWLAASRGMLTLLRVALLAGTAAFVVTTCCFIWFALQSTKIRSRR